MVSALALFVAANILAAVAPGYATMLIARVLAALGAAAFVPAASAVASSLAPNEYRGRALGTVVARLKTGAPGGWPFPRGPAIATRSYRWCCCAGSSTGR